MHRQIVSRFDGKMESVKRLWDSDPLWEEDGRTFLFADLCWDAIKAADFMRLPNASRLELLDALRERACQHSEYVNAAEVLSAIEQMNLGTSVYDVNWSAGCVMEKTGTEA